MGVAIAIIGGNCLDEYEIDRVMATLPKIWGFMPNLSKVGYSHALPVPLPPSLLATDGF